MANARTSRARWLLALLTTALSVIQSPVAAGRATCRGETATIVGRDSSEFVAGTNGDDVIVARGGNDYVDGKRGDDLICGNGGSDHLVAGSGRDELSGGGGEDTHVGGASTILMDGGSDQDTFFPSGGSGGTILGDQGADWLVFTDRLCAVGVAVDLAGLTATYPECTGWQEGAWALESIAHVDGSDGSDVIAGTDSRNLIIGQEGADTLRGRAGNDKLVGGPGRDTGLGGPGRDRCSAVETQRSC